MKFILAIFLVTFAAFSNAQIEGKEVQSRLNITVPFAYARAKNPVASAVLFQGGSGLIRVYRNGSMQYDHGFLASGAGRFSGNDISVAIVDVPSDRHDLNGGFRSTQEHAEDIAAVISFLRLQSNVPVWVIGTSNGSLSAANAAARLGGRGPDGVVLTSSTTKHHAFTTSYTHLVTDAQLQGITAPTLWVHHKMDECGYTPYDSIPPLVASMTKAKKAELISVEGGSKTRLTSWSAPCNAQYHQFQGIEAETIKQIADWIKNVEAKDNRGHEQR